jgi:hypothetical protein
MSATSVSCLSVNSWPITAAARSSVPHAGVSGSRRRSIVSRTRNGTPLRTPVSPPAASCPSATSRRTTSSRKNGFPPVWRQSSATTPEAGRIPARTSMNSATSLSGRPPSCTATPSRADSASVSVRMGDAPIPRRRCATTISTGASRSSRARNASSLSDGPSAACRSSSSTSTRRGPAIVRKNEPTASNSANRLCSDSTPAAGSAVRATDAAPGNSGRSVPRIAAWLPIADAMRAGSSCRSPARRTWTQGQ